MFFTKEFVMDEIIRIRRIVEEVHDESTVESPSLRGYVTLTQNGEKLEQVLFKLDVVRNAIQNVHTN